MPGLAGTIQVGVAASGKDPGDAASAFTPLQARVSIAPLAIPLPRVLPGDANGDGGLDISDAVATLGFLFLGSPAQLPCGDGSASDPANLKLVDWQPDGAIDISDAVATLSFLFLGGRPHALAPEADPEGCVRIEGCPEGAACQ